MKSRSAQFQLNSLHIAIFKAAKENRYVAVEHSPLEGRFQECSLLLALHALGNLSLSTRYFCRMDPQTARSLIEYWRLDLKPIRLRDTLIIRTGAKELHIGLEPNGLYNEVFISEADALPLPNLGVLNEGDAPKERRVVCLGVFSNKSHWFYKFARRTDVTSVQLDAEKIAETYPEVRLNFMPPTDPSYDRLMLLKDVDVDYRRQNFLSFARARLRIRTDKPYSTFSSAQIADAVRQGSPKNPIVTFEVSSIQRRYLAAKRKAISEGKRPWFVLVKYRRGGFTTLEQGLSYQVATTEPHSDVVTLAHTKESTQRIFRMVHLYHERDPRHPRLNSEAKSGLEFLDNRSLFFIGTAGGQGALRGDTIRKFHGSEVAQWCNGKASDVEELLASITGAASQGEIVLESTARGREVFYHFYNDAKNGTNNFTGLFLPWFADPRNVLPVTPDLADEIMDTLSAEEKALMESVGLSLGQIAFRRDAKRTYGRLFAQEMPEDDVSCFLTSGLCFFDQEALLRHLEKLAGFKPVLYKEHKGGFECIAEEPQNGVSYCIGADTSEGLPGCDRNGLGVMRKDTGKTVAWTHGLFSIRDQAEFIARYCRLYNDALTGIERENHGHAILERVKDLGINRPHFRGGPLFYFDQGREIKTSRPGWSTNAITRPSMLDDLSEFISSPNSEIYDRTLLDEGLDFCKQDSGKFEANAGSYDDSVIKWAICNQMRKNYRPRPTIDV